MGSQEGKNITVDQTDFIDMNALTRHSRFNVLSLAAESSSNIACLVDRNWYSTWPVFSEVEMSAFLWLTCLTSKKIGMLELYHMKLHIFPNPTEYVPQEGSEGSSSSRC